MGWKIHTTHQAERPTVNTHICIRTPAADQIEPLFIETHKDVFITGRDAWAAHNHFKSLRFLVSRFSSHASMNYRRIH